MKKHGSSRWTATLASIAAFIVVSPLFAQYNANFQTNIISGTTLNWSGDYVIGSNTFAGALVVTNAGRLTNSSGYVGYTANSSNNLAVVTGGGSVWTNSSQLTIGFLGAGNTLIVTNGGSLYDDNCTIGGYGESVGNCVIITGAGSYWKSRGIYVGWSGANNSMLISDGAFVSSSYGEVSHTTGGSNNTVVVTGTGSTWYDTGDFVVGGRFDSCFDNSLSITNSGALVVGGKMSISPVGVSSNNTVNVCGGQLSVSNGSITIGNGLSHGCLNISGGTVLVKDLLVTNGPSSILSFKSGTLQTRALLLNNGAPLVIGNGGQATWLPQAGTNSLMAGLLIGADCTSTGIVTITSGATYVTNVTHDATLEVRSGTLTLSGGFLQVDRFVMTNPCARFVRTGGALLVGTPPSLDPSGDADGDGLPNSWEQAYSLDPLDPFGNNGATGDPDGDGTSNANEYRAGTNPSDPASNLWASSWDSPNDGNWHNPLNWFTGLPSLSRPNTLITNAGSKTVTIDATTVLSNSVNGCLMTSNLTMRGVAGATNTLVLANAGTTTPLRIFNGLSVNPGSGLIGTNSALCVDGLAGGKFRVDGLMDFRNGELTTTNADMEIGYLSTGSVSITESGWRAKTVRLGMGYANSGGVLFILGGTNTISGGSSSAGNPSFSIGETSGATGRVYMVGGELTTTNGRSFIGDEGVGTMTISNGIWRAARADIAYWIYSSGTFNVAGGTTILNDPVWSYRGVKSTVNISGGELYTTNLTTIAGGYGASEILLTGGKWVSKGVQMALYDTGVSSLTVAGGVHDLGYLEMALDYGSRASMAYTGGELTTSALKVGSYGTADCLVSNRFWNAGQIIVGGIGGVGKLTLTGSTMQGSSLYIGGQTGTVWIADSELTITGGDSNVRGSLTISNGTWRAGNVNIGALNTNNPLAGCLSINGGTAVLSSNLCLGTTYGGGPGVVLLNQGDLIVTNGSTSIGFWVPGQMVLNGGRYLAREVRVGDITAPGTLSINSGDHAINSRLTLGYGSCTVTGSVSLTGGTLSVTNATHDATLEICAGTLTLGPGAALVVDRFVMTNACARFSRNGGVLLAGSVVLNPNDDTDGDGLLNSWEQASGLDPLDPTGPNGANGDFDADGFSNLQEYLADTNPTNSASALRFTFAGVTTNQLLLIWQGGIDATQRLWSASSLLSNNWQQISTFNPPTPITNSWLTPATNPATYYRLDAVR